MRSKREIKDRLRQASFRYLKTILDKRLKVVPANCGHNELADIAPGIELGMCTIFGETRVRVCDSRVPGCREGAGSCDWFVYQQSKEDIKAEWAGLLRSAQAGGRSELVRRGYGDLASLLWALDDEDEDVPVLPDVESMFEGGSDAPPTVPLDDDDTAPGLKQGIWNRLFGG